VEATENSPISGFRAGAREKTLSFRHRSTDNGSGHTWPEGPITVQKAIKDASRPRRHGRRYRSGGARSAPDRWRHGRCGRLGKLTQGGMKKRNRSQPTSTTINPRSMPLSPGWPQAGGDHAGDDQQAAATARSEWATAKYMANRHHGGAAPDLA